MYRLFIILILLLPLSASARIGIYLIPEVETDKKSLTLSDIAGIDGGQVLKSGSIIIPQSMYKDLIIDRKELNDYLAAELNETFAIFGNGVKLHFKEAENVFCAEVKEEKPVLIKKGETVELLIRNKGISIEMTGRAMQSGTVDDEVNVRLKNGRTFRGKPLGAGKVAVSL